MLDPKIIGRRLRFFRERTGMSQFDLEFAIDASPGSLSRIENGRVNPTKETLDKISLKLGLNTKEKEYCYGSLFYPATEEEIRLARADVNEHFRKKGTLAYLLDDRYRLIDLSDTFYKFLDLPSSLKEKILGRSFVEIVHDQDIDILGKVDKTALKTILTNQYQQFMSDMGFMVDDEYYQQALTSISKNTNASRIWQEVNNNDPKKIQLFNTREIQFDIKGFKIDLIYTVNTFLHNKRFDVIEYLPTNKLVYSFSKLL